MYVLILTYLKVHFLLDIFKAKGAEDKAPCITACFRKDVGLMYLGSKCANVSKGFKFLNLIVSSITQKQQAHSLLDCTLRINFLRIS